MSCLRCKTIQHGTQTMEGSLKRTLRVGLFVLFIPEQADNLILCDMTFSFMNQICQQQPGFSGTAVLFRNGMSIPGNGDFTEHTDVDFTLIHSGNLCFLDKCGNKMVTYLNDKINKVTESGCYFF